MSTHLIKDFFWVCLWRYFCKRLVFELVDTAKQMALLKVRGHHSILWGPGKGKLNFFFLPNWLFWDTSLLPSFGTIHPLVLRPSDSYWNHTTSWSPVFSWHVWALFCFISLKIYPSPLIWLLGNYPLQWQKQEKYKCLKYIHLKYIWGILMSVSSIRSLVS